MDSKVLIAAINWNGKDFIVEMIDSLLPQMEETNSRLLVFDNGSEDGSDHLIEEKYGKTGNVRVFRNEENIGFGKAANRIIQNAECPVVVFVNTDTVLKPDCLKNILQALDLKPDVAWAGPKLLWPDGTLQPSRRDFPFPGKLLLEHIPFLKKLTAKYSKHNKGAYTDWLVGALMAVRVQAFKEIGGFSSEFLFFHEETDLQYRFKKAGWKVWFEPTSEVFHLEGASSKKIYGSRIYLRNIPGKALFLKKHGTGFDLLSFKILMTILQFQRLIAGCLFRKLSRNDIRFTSNYCREAIQLLWHRKEKEK